MLARIKKYVLLVGALAIGLGCAIGVSKEKPEPQAKEIVNKLSKDLLANEVIEDFKIISSKKL